MSMSCVDAKARFRMVFFLTGSQERRKMILTALPFDSCRQPEEGSLLLQKIKECRDKRGVADDKCWDLVETFRLKHCMNGAVDKVLRERADSVEGF